LGGGRETVTDEIDHSVGLILHKKIGDYVEQGEPLVTVHDNGKWTQKRKEELLSAFHFSKEKVEKPILIDEIME
ncbi:MAG TPA: pyrimidine-nucleoside phosphorylase, partial [Catenibacterium sp.]|nr:pyrimidine-nucleoside phosphorylase [Catenibacterium sp.]